MLLFICYVGMLLFMFMFVFSSSFIMSWMLMEAGTLFYIMIICLQNSNQKFSSICSYFLIQSLGTSLFLVSLTFTFDNMYMDHMGLFMYNFSLSLKIGLFPFYKWVVSLIYNMNWLSIGLLSTFQKFMPMLMLSLNMWYYYLLFISIFTMMASLYFSLGLLSVKLLFSYSVLSHSAWLTLMLNDMNWWLTYYIVYSLLFFLICFFNYYFDINNMSDYIVTFFISRYLLVMYILNMISLTGMPPFTGFLLKWMLLDKVSSLFMYYFILLLVLTSLVHLYMYMRVILSSFHIYMGLPIFLGNYYWNYTLVPLIYINISVLVNLFILLLGLMIFY